MDDGGGFLYLFPYMVVLGIFMPRTIAKSEAEYVFVKIPKSLLEEVDRIIGKHGYRSRTEFVKDAIRSLLREYGVYRSEE